VLWLRRHIDTLLAAIAGASTATALVVRAALRVPITDSIADPSLIATSPSWAWWIAALTGALGGACLGKWLSRREAVSVLYPLLIPGLASVAYVPGAIAVIPFLAAFSGPLLDLVIVGCAVASLWRAARLFGGDEFAPSANQVAVAAFALYLLVGYHVQHAVGLTGDEPHYLLIVHSLLRDHDLEVADDYAEGSFRAFYDGKIGPHLAHGTSYSVHGIGLPLILLPGYALLGLTGVVLTKALLGAVAVRELFRAVEALAVDRRAALVAALAFGVTVPGLFLLTAAYPELPAAVLSIAVFRRWVVPMEIGPLAAVSWGLGFGLLPLLHIKFLTLTVVVAAGSLIFWPARRREVLVGASVALLAVLGFFFSLTGSWNPLASWGTQRVFWQGIPIGLMGLFFDQEAGLLPAAPFYVFALVALIPFSQRRPALGLLVLAALGAMALPAAAHPAWAGGASAPARYLFPALPLLAATAAAVWRWEPDRGMVPWARALLLVSVLFAGYAALVPGQYLYLNQKDGTGRLWEALGTSWDLTHYLPSIVRADTRSLVMALLGVALLLSAWVVELSNRAIRLPSWVAVVLLGTVGIDFVSPGAAPDDAMTVYMERLMMGAAEHQKDRFVSLPAGRLLRYEELISRIDIPLPRARGLSVPAEPADSWASSPIRLPGGEFVLEAAQPLELGLCNGEGCFERAHVGAAFQTRVGLSRFNVRAHSPPPDLHLRVVRLEEDFVTAHRSLGLANGLKIHALDDNVFVEPAGFWVRASSRARFALEQQLTPSTVLSLANGGVENWVAVQEPDDFVRFSLRPFEARRLEIPLPDGLGLIAVESSAGFRPVDRYPTVNDDRPLGVFVTTPVR
jgi:hypothetical protein